MNHKGAVLAIIPFSISQEDFEGAKEVIRIRKSKERQHNGQMKKDKGTNNDI